MGSSNSADFRQNARLPTSVKSGYGVAEIGLSSIELVLQVYLLELYLRAGLSPLWAGAALSIAVLWDAVSDPLVGVFIDRPTKTWSVDGKRMLLMACGCLLLVVVMPILMSPNPMGSQLGLFTHLLVWYVIMNTALTMVGVPHLTLVNDLTKEGKERADLFAWRLIMGGLGLLFGLSMATVVSTYVKGAELDGSFASYFENRHVVGLVLGAFAAMFGFVTIASVWKRLRPVGTEKETEAFVDGSFFFGLKKVFKLNVFKILLYGFVFISIGRALNGGLALIYYKVTLSFEESSVSAMLLTLTFSIMIATPVWVWLSRRYHKATLCVWGIVTLALVSAVVYPMFREGLLWPVLVFAVFGGGMVACIVLLESLFSDVVESERGKTSGDFVGASYGVWRMVLKISQAVGVALSSFFLYAVGYEEGVVEQSAFVGRSVAWVFGPVVSVFFVVGAFFVWKSRKLIDQEYQVLSDENA